MNVHLYFDKQVNISMLMSSTCDVKFSYEKIMHRVSKNYYLIDDTNNEIQS